MFTVAERETNINWTDLDAGIAHVYTCQPRMMRRLSKHPQAKCIQRHLNEDGKVTGEEYELPLTCIRIVSGTKRRVSEAQRLKAQRLREFRKDAVGVTANATDPTLGEKP